jgi:hypothetical protein
MSTKKSVFTSIAICLLSAVMFFASCKKDTPVTECFKDEYNGTYTGSGQVGNNPGYSGPCTVTKKGCQEAEIKAGTVVENITGLAASAGGGYTGKTSSGLSASISLTGNSISVAVGAINFSGSK